MYAGRPHGRNTIRCAASPGARAGCAPVRCRSCVCAPLAWGVWGAGAPRAAPWPLICLTTCCFFDCFCPLSTDFLLAVWTPQSSAAAQALIGGFMEMTSSDFDGLRAVCGMKSIHQWRHTRFLRFFRFRHIDPPSVRRPQATEQASRRMPKRLFCVVGMADHRRQGLGTAPLERGTVDHAHQSSNGTRQPTFGRAGRSLC